MRPGNGGICGQGPKQPPCQSVQKGTSSGSNLGHPNAITRAGGRTGGVASPHSSLMCWKCRQCTHVRRFCLLAIAKPCAIVSTACSNAWSSWLYSCCLVLITHHLWFGYVSPYTYLLGNAQRMRQPFSFAHRLRYWHCATFTPPVARPRLRAALMLETDVLFKLTQQPSGMIANT